MSSPGERGGGWGGHRRLAAAARVGALGIGATLLACAAPNLSRTVGAGNYELRANAGGPFFGNLGAPIPLPFVYVGGRYGVHDRIDVDGNLGVTSAAFGIWAMDLGANLQLHRQPGGLAVASSARLYLLGDLDDAPATRLYPELGLHLGGPVLPWLQLYGGSTALVQFRPPRGKAPLYVTPFFGVEFLLPARDGRRRARQHGIALHASWTNPWEDATSVVNYRPGYGALGLQLGYRARFGGIDR